MKTENRIYAVDTRYGDTPGWFASARGGLFTTIVGALSGRNIKPTAAGFRGMSKDEIADYELREEMYEWGWRNKA